MSALARRLAEILAEGVRAGAFPSGAAWVATGGRHRASATVGPVDLETRWDLASLTKPLVVGTLVMRAVAAGTLDLDARVAAPGGPPLALTDLLAHRAGLRAWTDLPAAVDAWHGPGRAAKWTPRDATARAAIDEALAAERAAADPGRGTCYSDLGYILLGRELERLGGAPLRRLAPGFLGLSPPEDPERYAPTGRCPRRGRALRGEVHDANAWVLGGAAGHAGAFASVDEIGRWALDLLRASQGREASVDGGVVRAFWDPAWRKDGATWVLGWDTPSPGGSTGGTRISASAVGHLGFTGTSVWIDREADLVTVLLTNRVAIGPASASPMRAYRPLFHDAVRDAV